MSQVQELQEQIRQLTLENAALKRLVATKAHDTQALESVAPKKRGRSHSTNDQTGQSPVLVQSPRTPSGRPRGCRCKGSCSTRVCGCVKLDAKCGQTCRCILENCLNQVTF